MKGKDEIKDLFEQKLSGYEANVRPELWVNISSQITAVPTGTGMSLFTKIAIGLSAAASVVILGYYIVKEEGGKDGPVPKTENTVVTENETKATQTDGEQQEITSTKGLSNTENITNQNITEQVEMPELNQKYSNNEAVLSEHNESGSKEEHVIPNNNTPLAEQPLKNKENIKTPVNDPAVVSVSEQMEEKGSIGELFNVFTPNGDGANDVLFIESDNVTDFSIVVIDPQNKIVYQSTDPSFRWDGTGMNGDPVPAGKYVYYVTARNSAGKVLSKHSVLQITR
jgi:gliding motility-associated-like protein